MIYKLCLLQRRGHTYVKIPLDKLPYVYRNFYLKIFETSTIDYATIFNPLHMALKSLVFAMQALEDGNSSM